LLALAHLLTLTPLHSYVIEFTVVFSSLGELPYTDSILAYSLGAFGYLVAASDQISLSREIRAPVKNSE